MGNNMTRMVTSIENIRIKMFDRVIKELKQVRFVQDLKMNLISLGMLENIGYNFRSKSGSLKVIKGSLVVIKGERKNGICVEGYLNDRQCICTCRVDL